MKNCILILLLTLMVVACQKPECKTKAGKAKAKYYNSLQYK